MSRRAPFFLGVLGWALATAGRKDEARKILEELRARPANSPTAVSEAWLLGALGEIAARGSSSPGDSSRRDRSP